MILLFTFNSIIIFIVNIINISAIKYGCFVNDSMNIEIASMNKDSLFIIGVFSL